MGEMVEFPSNGSSCSGYLAVPPSGSGPGVVVIQEWWGLVPHIERVCDRLAADGYVAVAVDLYHGETATEPDGAAKKMMALRMDRAGRDMSGAVQYLLGHQAVQGDAVGSVGFCMGGGLALCLAALQPAVKACVVYYGVIPWPDADPHLESIRGRVLGHYGDHDEFAGSGAVDALEQRLRDAGVDVTFHRYPGAAHAFFNDDRPEAYVGEAAELSYARTLEFFRATLGG